MSVRAREDRRQTELLHKAWAENGKVCGYRKLHNDLIDWGESICPSPVARLAQLAGIKAQIGHKRRPGSYGGKPAVIVNNTLARQDDVSLVCHQPPLVLAAAWSGCAKAVAMKAETTLRLLLPAWARALRWK